VRSPSAAFFGVGVEGVVEDLVLEADSGGRGRRGRGVVGVDEVLDAGVGLRAVMRKSTRSSKFGVLAGGEGCRRVARPSSPPCSVTERRPVFDLPSRCGGSPGPVSAVPALGGLAVEEEVPALGRFLFGESVGGGLWRGWCRVLAENCCC